MRAAKREGRQAGSETSSPSRQRARSFRPSRFSLLFPLFWTALLLAGCAANFYSTPRPFEGRHRNDPMLDSILRGASIEIRPVSGLPASEALALSRAVTQAAHEVDIAAVTGHAAEKADRLAGQAELVTSFTLPPLPPRLSVIGRNGRRTPPAAVPNTLLPPRANTELRISWALMGPDGTVKAAEEVRLPVGGTQSGLDKRERTEIAARTVAWLRGALDGEAARYERPAAHAARPIILVSPVEGASGDGRVSLTTALAELLAASGLCDVLAASELTRIPKGRSAYRVKGKVRIAEGEPGAQIVDIAWTVTDLVGREVGTVTQSNPVPRGSLDGPWGATAYAAAEGARDGLLALITQAGAPLPPVE